ncbi:MAG: xanthine dehydrogenase family protein molybdopterin-binding subunit [Rhodothalassiaceae bacterium]
MRQFGIGQPMRRLEDRRFLTGRGRYTDDIRFPGQLHGVVVRADAACGRIRAIETEAARGMPGVRLVLTAADLATAGIGRIPCLAPPKGGVTKERPVLAAERIRHGGEGVAFIVAESPDAAHAAAEAVLVDIDPEDGVGEIAAAIAPGAPLVHEEASGNIAFRWQTGDVGAVAEAFARAAHVTRIRLSNNRVAPTAMEPRAINALYDEGEGFTAYLGTQGVAGLVPMIARVLGIAAERIRLVTPDVGGGFGMKTFLYPEYILAMVAARQLGQPVAWTASRSESFLSDTHGRDLVSEAALAFDGDGRILGYRIETWANMGAYMSNFGPAIATFAPLQVMTGAYRIPAFHEEVRGVYTHTPWIDAYRGAGRPEAAYLLERLMSRAAREMGLGQDEIRRRNLVPPADMPYRNATGAVYDSGDFPRILATALARSDFTGFETRRKAAAAAGRYRGIGIACYVECTLGDPTEEIGLRFTEAGRLEVLVGTQSNGQGHETAYAQILGHRLGIDPARIDVVQGDSARKATGGGTGGSRSLQMIGNACVAAADAVIERGSRVLAALENCPPERVRFADDHFLIEDSNVRMDVLELAGAARDAGLPGDLAAGLDLDAAYTKPASTFPNGCHVAEVSIDPETGTVRLERYTVVDDFGTVINPLLVRGQVHGGVVQGIGQALGEAVRFDGAGQLLTGSLMDYGIPRAEALPRIDFHYVEIPCATNPLGLKGCGEAGTIGACPAVINAVLDALAPLGVSEIDMPATAHAIWQAIRTAAAAASA